MYRWVKKKNNFFSHPKLFIMQHLLKSSKKNQSLLKFEKSTQQCHEWPSGVNYMPSPDPSVFMKPPCHDLAVAMTPLDHDFVVSVTPLSLGATVGHIQKLIFNDLAVSMTQMSFDSVSSMTLLSHDSAVFLVVCKNNLGVWISGLGGDIWWKKTGVHETIALITTIGHSCTMLMNTDTWCWGCTLLCGRQWAPN